MNTASLSPRTATNMQMLLTIGALRAWLREKRKASPVERLFLATSAWSCPVAKYLSEKTGRRYSVNGITYYSEGRDCSELPLWAREYVGRIDSLAVQSITARTALDVLEKVASGQ